MPKTSIKLKIKGSDRKSIRDNFIKEFLKEEPGTGIGQLSSVYFYYVENTTDGVDIYLKRPAILNKGMDFELHAENVFFQNMSNNGNVIKRTRPSHSTIIRDLEEKKEEDEEKFLKLKELIDKIYNCEDIPYEDIGSLNFETGYSVELVLKIIKWLFIEQDVTYWNWSGRNKFYSGLSTI